MKAEQGNANLTRVLENEWEIMSVVVKKYHQLVLKVHCNQIYVTRKYFQKFYNNNDDDNGKYNIVMMTTTTSTEEVKMNDGWLVDQSLCKIGKSILSYQIILYYINNNFIIGEQGSICTQKDAREDNGICIFCTNTPVAESYIE